MLRPTKCELCPFARNWPKGERRPRTAIAHLGKRKYMGTLRSNVKCQNSFSSRLNVIHAINSIPATARILRTICGCANARVRVTSNMNLWLITAIILLQVAMCCYSVDSNKTSIQPSARIRVSHHYISGSHTMYFLGTSLSSPLFLLCTVVILIAAFDSL